MSLVVRLATIVGVLTLPAVLLAAALLGPRPWRWLKSLALGLVAGAPATVAIIAAGNRHPARPLPIATILVALIPGYLAAGALTVREMWRASSDWWADHRLDENIDPLADIQPAAPRPTIAPRVNAPASALPAPATDAAPRKIAS